MTRDVSELLSSAVSQERAMNRQCLLKIMRALQFLARQGCSIRGHTEVNSNFSQLLAVLSLEDKKVIYMSLECLQISHFLVPRVDGEET